MKMTRLWHLLLGILLLQAASAASSRTAVRTVTPLAEKFDTTGRSSERSSDAPPAKRTVLLTRGRRIRLRVSNSTQHRRRFRRWIAQWSTTSVAASTAVLTPTDVTTSARSPRSKKRTIVNNTAAELLVEHSNLRTPGRTFHIVTTAALPWFTGTAVNPLLRAAHLHDYTRQNTPNTTTSSFVTLVIPWLELPADQELVYQQIFPTQQDQEIYIRDWLRQAGLTEAAQDLHIIFYPARYHAGLGSVFAMGDMIQNIRNASDKLDVCILEEPEHSNWYRAPGEGWTTAFDYVIGIVHTNYKEYASNQYHGLWTAPALQLLSSAMVRAYCHQVIKLSNALQTYAPEKEVVSNVHGVRHDFLQVYEHTNATFENADITQDQSVYFIGKLLWTKGLDLLLDLQDYYKACTGKYFAMDIYGNGPDETEIQRAFWGRKQAKQTNNETKGLRKLHQIKEQLPKSLHEYRKTPVPVTFPGRVDHAALGRYKVFVNPSVSEVLCTTTAEAMAMGKWVIIPDHPSNTFFLKFPNCLAYRNKIEFVANLRWALTHEPEPLSEELVREFTWGAATERFLEASAITYEQALERQGMSKLDERIAWLHQEMGKGATGDLLRLLFGAGPVSKQVRYQREQSAQESDSDDDEEEDSLRGKFRKSSLAQAIRATVDDLSSFMQ